MGFILNGERIILGTCYYPEHWSKSDWAKDLERMKGVGIQVIRIAEFAWNIFEPKEGEFSFEFFDEFLDLAKTYDMKVIFSTPTATPPAWLSHRYPEILNVDKDGHRYRHGARRHYNYNSEVYQKFTSRIVEQLGRHYGKHPMIIGWQIDNELNCETDVFYSPSDAEAFRNYLKGKFHDIDDFNKAIGAVFWNQTYTEWEEIELPKTTESHSANPHLELEYLRFISMSTGKYAKLQSDLLRKYIKPDDFLTTNGMFNHVDNHQLMEESLDYYMYDSYPDFAYGLDTYDDHVDSLRDRNSSRALTSVRAIAANFGIMEQQSGPNGWNTKMEASAPRPGQMTLWTFQSIAHGADYISFFRWRTCTFGTEIYWHGILDYSGRENRRLKEVEDIYKKLQEVQAVAGSLYEAKVGIIRDYDNRWDVELDKWHRRVEEISLEGIFEACQRTHTPYDEVYLRSKKDISSLIRYKVLFYPHATMINDWMVEVLSDYVQQGGTLVFGCRSGYKDEKGHCVKSTLPGLLKDLCKVDVYEYSLIPPDLQKIDVNWKGDHLQAEGFVDLLNVQDQEAELEGQYTEDYMKGAGALVKNTYGKGYVYYYGSTFNQETTKLFMDRLGVISPFKRVIELPETCELAIRKTDDHQYIFVLNYKQESADIELKEEMYDLLEKKKVVGHLQLKAYGVKVFEV